MTNNNEYPTVTPETQRLLDGQEGRDVEFKRSPRAIDAEDIVAFANASGGTILAGVDEIEAEGGIQRGIVRGCQVDDQTRQAIIGKAASCRPAVDIDIRAENTETDKPILRIDIPDGPNKPYATGSGTYKIRSEASNVAIDPPLMKTIILESEADQFIDRFKHAADELMTVFVQMNEELSERIREAQEVAERANESALRAERAAQEAIDAANNAVVAAEDPAHGES